MDPRTDALWTEQLLAHGGWIRDLARKLVADSSTADDVVQQTWLAALIHPPSAARSLRPWLGRVLRVQIALRWRRAIHGRDREAAAARPEPLPSAEELAMRTEAHERLVRAVRNLREPYRSAIVLHYYEGLSSAEIARRRGVPDATVRSQIHRGLGYLRADLDADFGDRRSWCLALAPLDLERPVPGAPLAAKLFPAWLAALAAAGLGWLAWPTRIPLGDRPTHTSGAVPAQVADGPRPGSTGRPDVAPVEAQRVPALAQEDAGGCVVRVIDQGTGEPLPDFQVVVRRPSGETLLARTGSTGDFRLDLSGSGGAWEFDLVDDARLRQRDARVHGARIQVRAPSERRELAADTAEVRVPRERRELAADTAELVVAVPAGPTYVLDLELPPRLALSELRAHLRTSGPPAFDTRKWALHVAPVRPPGGLDAAWVRFAEIKAAFLGAGPPWTLELSSADGFWSGSAEVSSIAGRHAGRLRVVIEPRARLRGRVLDALGPMTEDVLLHLLRADGSPTYRRVDTDGEGGFALAALEPGPFRLRVESARHATAEVELSLEAGIETVRDVELVRAPVAGVVEGLLTSRTGRYQRRVIVVLASQEVETRRFFAMARWELRGDRWVSPFAFDEMPRGRYWLQVFSCDDQLPWQPQDLELAAPEADLRLECQDDLETTSLAFHAVDGPSGEALSSFTLAYSIDGGPEVVLADVRPAPSAPQSALAEEPLFEWRVRFADTTWALRSGPAQIPGAPRGRALRWGVFADGHAPVFGDEAAFVEQDGRPTARVALERGWGCRLRVVADGAAREPLGDVELWADGQAVAASRPDGRLECRLQATPRELELRLPGWRPQAIEPSPSLPRQVWEVPLRR